MVNYITEKYAGILTKEDVVQLFNRMTEKLQGNRSEAIRQCGLTGKATYDWEKAKYVKLGTKQKVLEACLGINFLDTTEYLLDRSNDRTVDILRTFISKIYMDAIETESKGQFRIMFKKFSTSMKKHQGLIKDQIEDEVADMSWLMRQKASELDLPVPEKTIEDMSLKEWLGVFPVIVDTYVKDPQESQLMAETLDLPRKSIEILWSSFEKLKSVELTTQVNSEYAVAETGGIWVLVGGKAISPTEEPFMHKPSVKRIPEASLTA